MKKFSLLLICIFTISVAFTFSSCNRTDTKTTSGADSTAAAYDCPMKCEGAVSANPGKCPVCKMELTKQDKTDVAKDTMTTSSPM